MRFSAGLVLGVLAASKGAAFEPGSLGDAYRDTGYVQGCTDGGELPGCTIIAGGSQFVVPAEGPSPPEVMERLRAAPKLSWIEFRGDLLNIYDSYGELALGAFDAAPEADPYNDLVTAAQGEWVSTDDPKAKVVVDGLIWRDVYDGEDVAQSVISFGDSCSDGASGGRLLELFGIGSAEPVSLCYSIVGIDAERMEMIYLPRGNALVYGRP